MTEIRGVGIGLGVAQGPVARMAEPLPAPLDEPSALTPDEETARVTDAVAAVARELEERGAQAGGAARDVLEAQAMMAEDPTLADEVGTRIRAGKTGEFAVHDAFASFREQLTALGGYLGERAADLDDVAQRVIARLRGVAAPGVPDPGHPFVLVAKDLAPADTALLDLDKVLALVTTEGGPTSHTAILAREKSIVAIVGAGAAKDLVDGETVIVDAAKGVVTTDPTDEERAQAQRRADARASAASAPITDGALADGTAVPLLANLGNPAAAAEAVALGAEGVGLFRTEFLFLSSAQAPTVEQQREAYTQLLGAFPGKKVVVRVLDAGADKPLPFLNDAHEENPALGLRGLRALRASEDILREQLTALAEADAATDADLWVMAPMVSTVEEAEYFTAVAREYGVKTAGVMVEVPSSALLADHILASADFASIGTNDLTQYTLAMDRGHPKLAPQVDGLNPAVLGLIAQAVKAAHAASRWVGVCGGIASDPQAVPLLVGLGVDELSVSIPAIPAVKAAIRSLSLSECQALAARALTQSSAADVRALVPADDDDEA